MNQPDVEETLWRPLVVGEGHWVCFDHPFRLPFDACALTTIMPCDAVRATAVCHL